MDIEPEELRGWMKMTSHLMCKDMKNDRTKPEIDVKGYENGTWMISGWIDNKNNPSSEYVERGENMDMKLCTNKLGCACVKNNLNDEMGPPKELPDLMRGDYSCITGIGMKRKRTSMSRGTFRTTTSTWSGRARSSTPVRGRRRCQKFRKESRNQDMNLIRLHSVQIQYLRSLEIGN